MGVGAGGAVLNATRETYLKAVCLSCGFNNSCFFFVQLGWRMSEQRRSEIQSYSAKGVHRATGIAADCIPHSR